VRLLSESSARMANDIYEADKTREDKGAAAYGLDDLDDLDTCLVNPKELANLHRCLTDQFRILADVEVLCGLLLAPYEVRAVIHHGVAPATFPS
jgi:hypothetical protein